MSVHGWLYALDDASMGMQFSVKDNDSAHIQLTELIPVRVYRRDRFEFLNPGAGYVTAGCW
jgi:hypothetical protein